MKSFSFPLFNSFGKIWLKEIQEECIEWDDRLWGAKNTNDLRRMEKNRKLFWGRAVQILRKISHSIWWGGNSGDFIFLNKESVSLVQFSNSVVSDFLRPHGLQHTRPTCPSPTPRVHSNSCPWVGDAIHPSHPLLTPSPPAFNLSQNQGLFQWVSSLHQVAKVLEFQLQHQSFQWTPRTDLL